MVLYIINMCELGHNYLPPNGRILPYNFLKPVPINSITIPGTKNIGTHLRQHTLISCEQMGAKLAGAHNS